MGKLFLERILYNLHMIKILGIARNYCCRDLKIAAQAGAFTGSLKGGAKKNAPSGMELKGVII